MKKPEQNPAIKRRFPKNSTEPKKRYNNKNRTGHTKSKQSPQREEGMRLNRFIASTGVCSRREADEYIASGLVMVNGKVVTEMGTKVSFQDVVKFNGKKIRQEKRVYILLNKPKDFVTTMDDPHVKRTVMELIKNACRERVFPVGRLDRMTTGVLLLTNDGELTKKLTHPKFNKKKIYHIHLNKSLKRSDMSKIAEGVTLDDGLIKADAISYVGEDKKQVGIEIHSGRNRIIRRIFESLGYRIDKLDRVYFAGLTKKGIPRGKWRFLTDQEISKLKMNAYD